MYTGTHYKTCVHICVPYGFALNFAFNVVDTFHGNCAIGFSMHTIHAKH